MISPEKAEKLDDYDLCEELENRLHILALCIQAIDTNYGGAQGLFPAFNDTDILANEMKQRLSEDNSN